MHLEDLLDIQIMTSAKAKKWGLHWSGMCVVSYSQEIMSVIPHLALVIPSVALP